MKATVYRNDRAEIVGAILPANGGEELDIFDTEYQEFINKPSLDSDPIDAAEQHIGKFFSTPRLLQMKVWWDTFPHEVTPKLAQTYQWTDAVTRSAIAGGVEFSDPPHTFQAIAEEIVNIES
jgi:hypothetical protein